MDSDLADSLTALREAFARRRVPSRFGKAEPSLVTDLRARLRLPRRYREFLTEADPLIVETRTPSERVRLFPAGSLLDEQRGFSLEDDGALITRARPTGWRAGWVIVARSSLLGDPYFLDTASPDAEGDCPVYTAMSGTEQWRPVLAATSFALFLRVLAVAMEVGADFADHDADDEDERLFRDTLGPRLRLHDPAAAKAGHWT